MILNTPKESLERMRGMIFSIFGGKEKMEIWMNRIADQLANPNDPQVQPQNFDPSIFPPELQKMMHHPKEVVDFLLDLMDSAAVFIYTAELKKSDKGTVAIVRDKDTGHVIEVVEKDTRDEVTIYLAKKYENNLEFLKE